MFIQLWTFLLFAFCLRVSPSLHIKRFFSYIRTNVSLSVCGSAGALCGAQNLKSKKVFPTTAFRSNLTGMRFGAGIVCAAANSRTHSGYPFATLSLSAEIHRIRCLCCFGKLQNNSILLPDYILLFSLVCSCIDGGNEAHHDNNGIEMMLSDKMEICNA